MSKKETIKVRAPKIIMNELRGKFPGIHDADLITIAYNTSALRVEAAFRKPLKKRKKRSDELI